MMQPATRRTFGRLVVAAIGALAAWALAIATWGSVTFRVAGVTVTSRSPVRSLIYGGILAVVYATVFARVAPADLWPVLRRRGLARTAAASLALVTLGLGLGFGTFVAGGADAFGYVSQADGWLAGTIRIDERWAASLPWPEPLWTVSPLGYRPAPDGAAIVPSYAAGLPLLMAAFKTGLGSCGPFIVSPALAALGVWLTFLLGAQWVSPAFGVAAAALVATSPTFLFQLMWPMSDSPAMTCLLLATFLIARSTRRTRPRLWLAAAGLAMAAMLVIRPNLAMFVPLLALLAAWSAGPPVTEGTPVGERAPLHWLHRLGHAVVFSLGAAPGAIFVAALQWQLYGSPTASGYGAASELYRAANLTPNLALYTGWLVDTETPFVAVALIPVVASGMGRGLGALPVSWLTLIVVGGWASYLFYSPFEDWWYLRFLLPTYPAMFLLAAAGVALLVGRLPAGVRAAVACAALMGILLFHVSRAREAHVLTLWRDEQRYVHVARYVADHLPDNAVVLSMQHSGSLRYYAGVQTIRYDWLPAGTLQPAIDALRARGQHTFIVLDTFELPAFERRFADDDRLKATLGRPLALLLGTNPVNVYDAEDLPGLDPALISTVGAPRCQPAARARPVASPGR